MRLLTIVVLGSLTLGVTGCGGPRSSVFLHPEFDFQFVERVAVIPFENLTEAKGAAARSSRMFLTELLATEAFDVVEPGEVSRVLEQFGTVRTSELPTELVKKIGRELKVQGLFLGSVTESTTTRNQRANTSTFTLVLRLVEAESGVTVWSTTATSSGKGFWSSLFGTGNKTHSQVISDCIKKALESLID